MTTRLINLEDPSSYIDVSAAKTGPDPFTWIKTDEIFEPLPPTQWLVPELLIAPGRPTLLAAYGYSAKTLTAQSLAIAIASGTSAWGHFATGAPRRVRHVDHEQGRHATLKRYQRLTRGHGLSRDELGDRLEVSILPTAYLNAADAGDAYSRAFDGIDLGIIDALRGATPGDDENDSLIRTRLDTLTHVSERTGTTFLLIHHAGKPKDGHSDARTIPRGSSAIFDACGCVLVLVGDKAGPKLVRQEKTPAEAEGAALADFYLQVEDVADEDNPRAGVRVVYRSKEAVSPTADPARVLDRQIARARAAIGEHPGVGMEALRAYSRLSPGDCRGAVAILLELGEVESLAAGRKRALRLTPLGLARAHEFVPQHDRV